MEEKMDLRIQKTYLALHNAFTEILEEKRFDEMTVNELCDRAMIRRTTFYKHFADKYEYFSFYIREITSTFQDRLAPDVAEDEVNAYLLHMSREMVRFLQQHEKLVRNIRTSSMFPVLLRDRQKTKRCFFKLRTVRSVFKQSLKSLDIAADLLYNIFQRFKTNTEERRNILLKWTTVVVVAATYLPYARS